VVPIRCELSRSRDSANLPNVPDLNGAWEVERTGGLLPPLVGVRKHISGMSGQTAIGAFPGAPFDVVGLELRYRRPFRGFVDVLEPEGDGFSGRATFRGREFGRFRMCRVNSTTPPR
jgi:hypothetical protein